MNNAGLFHFWSRGVVGMKQKIMIWGRGWSQNMIGGGWGRPKRLHTFALRKKLCYGEEGVQKMMIVGGGVSLCFVPTPLWIKNGIARTKTPYENKSSWTNHMMNFVIAPDELHTCTGWTLRLHQIELTLENALNGPSTYIFYFQGAIYMYSTLSFIMFSETFQDLDPFCVRVFKLWEPISRFILHVEH